MVRRGLRKPPRVILERVVAELRAESERVVAPGAARRAGGAALLRSTSSESLEELWEWLARRPSLVPDDVDWAAVTPPEERRIVLEGADAAMSGRVSLLGAETTLTTPIDWHRDWKTGRRWGPAFHRTIEYTNLDQPSDVKVPWELSRLQWMIPVGQAYLLTGDERYAQRARDVLSDWIRANPYAWTVNWTTTMEVALRIVVWTWLFQVFHCSLAWSEPAFRDEFLTALHLHGRFTERHLEKSDINGNHYTADAAGLVVAGLFFGRGRSAARWSALGWRILSDELPKQVGADGADFEGSVPYHRLVTELFLLPALYRLRAGEDVDAAYRELVCRMGHFTAAYSRPDGSVPLIGDADDGRALPLGVQDLNDHRYLVGLVGEVLGDASLVAKTHGPVSEIRWLLGSAAADRLEGAQPPSGGAASASFPDSGYYVMANATDHVFIDCAPVGLGGRGGHGHNDCLSFEAVLDGVHLVTDAGAYLYTASPKERNAFRSTASHNTPQIDDAEINRFIRPDYLWNLHDDAHPEVRSWATGADADMLVGTHTGYLRLDPPIRPVREVRLEHPTHTLRVTDTFETETVVAVRRFRIPLLLAPGVRAHAEGDRVVLDAGDQRFVLQWDDARDWDLEVADGRVSPSYGVVTQTCRLIWHREGPPRPLSLTLAPAD